MLETEGEPGGEVVHVFTGRGLFQEISGEEMGVISRECDVPVQSPFQHSFGLVAHVTGVAGPARLDDVDGRAVNPVMGAFAPKAIPVQVQG